MTVAVVLAIAMLSLSVRVGRLSIPLAYDDVAYVLSGFEVYKQLLQDKKLGALGLVLEAHAPLQTALAAFGLILFGLHEWSVYAANVLLLLALTAVALWIVRSLRLLSQIAIVAVVLSTPLAANLVTEFRPDLIWGLLCGFAAYLIFDNRFLNGSRPFQILAAIVTGFALLGKPSAIPATAIFLIYAVSASAILSYREHRISINVPSPIRANILLFFSLVLIMTVPYYIYNIDHVTAYIYGAVVEQFDIYGDSPTIWRRLSFYLVGEKTYRYALYLTLWVGCLTFIVNILFFARAKDMPGLLRYLAFGGAVIAAYCAPTMAPFRSFYLGGIFYGTFLFFTVHGLVLLFSLLEKRSIRVSMILAGLLLAFSVVFIFRPHPLYTKVSKSRGADLTNVNNAVVGVLTEAVSKMPRNYTPIIHLAQPSPLQGEYLQLKLRWAGHDLGYLPGTYVRTLEEQQDLVRRSNFVALTDEVESSTRYPGQRFAPQLLKIVKSNPDFVELMGFTSARGDRTYLFERRSSPFPKLNSPRSRSGNGRAD